MKLYKSENSLKGSGINKFSLKCEEDKLKYLNLINILYKSVDENAIIIKGLYDNKKDIVLHLWKFKMPIIFYNFLIFF
jgi:hypothetical protein